MSDAKRYYKTKVCLVCGKEYQPTGNRQLFCTKCGFEAMRERNRVSAREWSIAHPERVIAWHKVQYATHQEETKARSKMWGKNHPERVTILSAKMAAKRRVLGFHPLNSWFSGCEAHHVDKEHVVYTPKTLHHSVPHNIWTGKNMDKINAAVFAYLEIGTVAPELDDPSMRSIMDNMEMSDGDYN